jgi:hypothetical protein
MIDSIASFRFSENGGSHHAFAEVGFYEVKRLKNFYSEPLIVYMDVHNLLY